MSQIHPLCCCDNLEMKLLYEYEDDKTGGVFQHTQKDRLDVFLCEECGSLKVRVNCGKVTSLPNHPQAPWKYFTGNTNN